MLRAIGRKPARTTGAPGKSPATVRSVSSQSIDWPRDGRFFYDSLFADVPIWLCVYSRQANIARNRIC